MSIIAVMTVPKKETFTVAYSYRDHIRKLVPMEEALATHCCRNILIRSELARNPEHCPTCGKKFHQVFTKIITKQPTTVDERFNLAYESGLPLKLQEGESLSTRQKVWLAFKRNVEPELEPGETIPLDLRIVKYVKLIFASLKHRAVLLDEVFYHIPSRIKKAVYSSALSHFTLW